MTRITLPTRLPDLPASDDGLQALHRIVQSHYDSAVKQRQVAYEQHEDALRNLLYVQLEMRDRALAAEPGEGDECPTCGRTIDSDAPS